MVVVVAAPFPPAAESQSPLSLQACKQIDTAQTPSGSRLITRQCGTQFTTKDAYIVFVITVYSIRDPLTVIAELIDPEQTTVWMRQYPVASPAPAIDTYIAQLWLVAVLPVAADTETLARESLRLLVNAIAVKGKPVIERLGQWTVRARIGNGALLSLRFTLQQAP